MSPKLNECYGRELTVHLFMWAFTSARRLTRQKLEKDQEQVLEHKAISHQVGKEKGKYKEEAIEKMQD